MSSAGWRSGCLSEQLRSSETPDRAQAEAMAREHEANLNAPSALASKPDPTFGTIYDAYLAASQVDNEIADNTKRDRRNTRPRLSELTLWSLPVSKIDKAALLTSRDELKTKVKKASTVQHYFDLAKLAWKWAQDRGRLATPWPGLERLKKTETDKRPLSDEECERVLQAIKARAGGRWHPFFCLQADVGCRIDSVIGVKGSHIDRASSKVFLTTKTGSRWFAVPPETVALLPEVAPDAYAWSTKRGGRLRRETPYSIFKKALKDAGIPDLELVDTHSLRRRWITSAGDSGVPLPVAMAQVDHREVKNHLRYRAHAPTPDTRAAVELVRARRVAALRNEASPRGIPGGTPTWGRPIASTAASAAASAGSYDLTS